MRLEQARPGTEGLGATAPHDVAHDLSCAPGAADNLLDRHTRLMELQHGSVGRDALPPAFILRPFRRCQDRGINRLTADRLADVGHRATHRCEERRAGVLHQMPAVGDLPCLRPALYRRRAVATTTVTSDEFDRGPRRQPGLHCRHLTVGKHIDDPPPLEIADDRAIAMALAPCPVVDADHPGRQGNFGRTIANNAKERVLAHRQEQADGGPLAWPSAERNTDIDGRCPRAVRSCVQTDAPPMDRAARRRSAACIRPRCSEIAAPEHAAARAGHAPGDRREGVRSGYGSIATPRPHRGQMADFDGGRTNTNNPPGSTSTRSTTNPTGTIVPMPARLDMMLLLQGKPQHLAIQMHQDSRSEPILDADPPPNGVNIARRSTHQSRQHSRCGPAAARKDHCADTRHLSAGRPLQHAARRHVRRIPHSQRTAQGLRHRRPSAGRTSARRSRFGWRVR